MTTPTTSNSPKDDFEYHLNISRPVYTQKRFQSEFELGKSEKRHRSDTEGTNEEEEGSTNTSALNRSIESTCGCFRRFFDKHLHPKHLIGVFTILNLITEYNFKECFLADVFSGLTGEIFKGLIKTTLSTNKKEIELNK